MINFKIEKQFNPIVVGIDEAGRGPLAGPVVTCALFLKEYQVKDYYHRINDSKKLSEKLREEIYNELTMDSNISYSIHVCNNNIIDEINILEATKHSMFEAYRGLNITAQKVLVDGNHKMSNSHEITQPIIKGDSLVFTIAAASIIAKVERDKIMLEYDKEYPQYGFKKHKGYGTKLHLENLNTHGACPIHRFSFAPIRKLS